MYDDNTKYDTPNKTQCQQRSLKQTIDSRPKIDLIQNSQSLSMCHPNRATQNGKHKIKTSTTKGKFTLLKQNKQKFIHISAELS